MKKQSLNGPWKYRIGKGEWTEKEVPFSTLPVGHSECKRYFDACTDYDIILLELEGITYSARVYLNGTFLGKMVPYSEYTFDIKEIVKEKNNELLVLIEDINVPFGPSEGWENYGGIIRDVSVSYFNSACFEDVYFRAELRDNFKNADYCLQILTRGNENTTVKGTLSYNNKVIDSFRTNDKEISRYIENIDTWSPKSPNLYELCLELLYNDIVVDTRQMMVGFREIKCEKHRFLLNGKPIFLKGVCKHEMVGDKGHTVSEAEIERDLKMIKAMGCNFVRLVHYPHNKKTLELADRIGLLTCEEPGLWQSDTKNEELARTCLEVLKRTVIRDRSHPSIIFWLCFNECDFDEQFLKNAVKICKENDKDRLVSGANNMCDEDTLKYYNLCGLDFYTTHPYSNTIDLALKSAKALNDKPLMFTEWGGYYVYDNPHLLCDFIAEMHRLYEQNDENGALAGFSFWYFAEINDFNRGGVACKDGALKEALVDVDRKPTMIYDAFCKSLSETEKITDPTALYQSQILDASTLGKRLTSKAKRNYEAVVEKAKNPLYTRLAKTRKRQVLVGPVSKNEEISAVPYLLSDNDELEFSLDESVSTISVVGLTSLTKGYPLFGEYGEECAEIILEYGNGKCERKKITNGKELTIAYTSIGSSRIEPIAEKSKSYLKFSYDKNFETYVVNRLNISVDNKAPLKTVKIKALSNGYDILIYDVFAQ